MSICYYNGQFVKADEISISIDDRSYKYGDAVFDTLAFFNGKIFNYNFHAKRISAALKAVNIKADIPDVFAELITKNKLTDGFIRIHVSRGDYSKGYLALNKCKPNILIEAKPRTKQNHNSFKLKVSPYKKIPLECLPSNYKTGNSLNSSLALMDAHKSKTNEAIQLSIEAYVCECASANIFWIKNRVIYTPSLDLPVLDGSIRNWIVKNYKVKQGKYKLPVLLHADEVFITNVNLLIQPVTNIKHGKGYSYDNGKLAGELLEKLRECL